MARYDVAPAWYRTPGGHAACIFIREDTNDHNTAYSAIVEDEYRTAELDFAGRFLDIGGHLGTVSITILLDHPETSAVIVEPIPENIEFLRLNLEANHVADRAQVIPGLVGVGRTRVDYAFTHGEN